MNMDQDVTAWEPPPAPGADLVAAALSEDRVIVYVEDTETEWIQADHAAPVADCR